MSILRVLVDSRRTSVSDLLRSRLSGSEFEVLQVSSGSEFVERALTDRPEIAIIDMDKERSDSDVAITVLKNACPDARIIALSSEPSKDDGAVIERGIFYYLSGPWRETLVQVVEAAARSFRQRLVKSDP